jgi:hypothetical protein
MATLFGSNPDRAAQDAEVARAYQLLLSNPVEAARQAMALTERMKTAIAVDNGRIRAVMTETSPDARSAMQPSPAPAQKITSVPAYLASPSRGANVHAVGVLPQADQ